MFLWEYLKHPFRVGAVAPGGRGGIARPPVCTS